MLKPYSLLLFSLLLCLPRTASAAEIPLSIDEEAMAVVYSGQEKMHFSISWSGGIKIGDLYMTISPAESGDGHTISVRVTDYGLFKFFYPVDDRFTTYIRGPLNLPYRYEVHQKEGRDMDVRRLTVYDQKKFTVSYRKNNNPVEHFTLDGSAYNEFSSFIITRVLRLASEREEIVPTFVDKKRHLVPIKVFGVEPRDSIFGRIDTIKVMPMMDFKGLYDKEGDTVFWLTNDSCRVPVEIDSKIAIGSLVGELVEYANPACRVLQKNK